MSFAWLYFDLFPLMLMLVSMNTIDSIDAHQVLAQTPTVQPSHGNSVPGQQPMKREKRINAIRVISFVLLAVLLLFLVVLLGGFILTRSARRHQIALDRQQRPPTPSDDVWVQHKLPEGSEDYLDTETDDSLE